MTADANTLTGTTLKSTVTASSLVSLGVLTSTVTTANNVPFASKDSVGTIRALVKITTGDVAEVGAKSVVTTLKFFAGSTTAGMSLNLSALTVTGAFGCNGATAQMAYASGGALVAYGAGANGFDSGANAAALHALVVAIRSALVANGIMS